MLECLAVNPDRSEQEDVGFKAFCRQFLLRTQNSDGGWPYQAGLNSATEPTCWAMLALQNNPDTSDFVHRGLARLKEIQRPDGAWPGRPGNSTGCWATSLASLTMFLHDGDCGPVRMGLRWLCSSWPAESRLWWRTRTWLRPTATVAGQDSSLAGWSWTPAAASWVEPTAYSLILLNTIPQHLHPRHAAKRRRLGEAMLYDRMCPGGGWNTGNPLVYGVPGERRVGPTAWALLALQGYSSRSENQQSLRWLENVYPEIAGPASLALAHLCLEAHARPQHGFEARLASLYQRNGFLDNVPAVALSLIALIPPQDRSFGNFGRREADR